MSESECSSPSTDSIKKVTVWSTYEKVSLYRTSEHKIYVYASSYVCVYVHLYLRKGKFVQGK